MQTVVITGSARGFGFEMAKKFRSCGANVVISDVNAEGLVKAEKELNEITSEGKVIHVPCDVTNFDQLENLWAKAQEAFGGVDIWINNAGVNQPDKPCYELTPKEVEFMLNIDLKGTIFGTQVAFKHMKEQGHGQIYAVEGYGSNDAMMTGLTIYGTTKRAVTYFLQAMAVEAHDLTNDAVKVCRLTPGIMITQFITSANGGATKVELPEKTKKVYNILGDYPETIANYLVPKMLVNKKNNAKIVWLTSGRAFARFMGGRTIFHKVDFFKDN